MLLSITYDNNKYSSIEDIYGIKVFCKEGVKLIEDVSTDYYFVKSIVDRFTKFKLDPVHIYEAIQDAFAEY